MSRCDSLVVLEALEAAQIVLYRPRVAGMHSEELHVGELSKPYTKMSTLAGRLDACSGETFFLIPLQLLAHGRWYVGFTDV